VTPDAAPKKRSLLATLADRWPLVLAVVVAVLVVALVVGFFATSQPSFFSRYALYQHNAIELETSMHKGLTCNQCHASGTGTAYRLALVADFYVDMVGTHDEPTFGKFSPPNRNACLACHEHDWSDNSAKTSKIPHPAHLRVATETRDCVTCHRWTAHEETIMLQHQKAPFSVVCASFGCHVGVKPHDDCKNCHHQLQPSLAVWRQVHPKVVLSYGPNACLEQCHKPDQCVTCHTTGKLPVFPGVIQASTVTTIEAGHVKPDWITKHGSFMLAEGQAKCLTCHITTQECQDCHAHRPAFHGTDNTAWIGTGHEKFAKVSTKGCFECHQPTLCNNCHQQFGAKVATFPASASQIATP